MKAWVIELEATEQEILGVIERLQKMGLVTSTYLRWYFLEQLKDAR